VANQNTLPMKQQFVVTHTIRQTVILPHYTKTEFSYKRSVCQNVVSTHKIGFSLYFRKNITCILFDLLIIFKFFLSPEKLCIGGLRQIGVPLATFCPV
jgi:hypothetical protein